MQNEDQGKRSTLCVVNDLLLGDDFLIDEFLEDSRNGENSRPSSAITTRQCNFPNSLDLQPPEYYQRQATKGRRKSTNPVYMPSLRIFRRDIR